MSECRDLTEIERTELIHNMEKVSEDDSWRVLKRATEYFLKNPNHCFFPHKILSDDGEPVITMMVMLKINYNAIKELESSSCDKAVIIDLNFFYNFWKGIIEQGYREFYLDRDLIYSLQKMFEKP